MYSSRFHFFILVILICSSSIFRFTNLDWDNGQRIHPDEALIVNSAQSIKWFDNLNPKFHDYNGFSVYLLSAASILTHQTSIEDMTIVGRYLSASISVISVLLFYLLVIKLFPPTIALFSAAVFSFSPLLIQLAHFYTTDSILVFLLILLLWHMNAYSIKPSIKNLIFLSIPLGLSIATKNTGYLFLPLPILTIMIQKNRNKYFFLVFLALLVLLSFFFASPYSFLDFSGYLSRGKYLSDVVSGKLLFDWTIQFQQTTPLYWFFQTLWAFGPIAVIGPVGILLFMYSWLKTRSIKQLPLFLMSLWTLGFGLFLSLTYLKFIRYNAPLLLGYSIGFSYLLYTYRRSIAVRIVLYVFIIIQLLYGVMFSSIYITSHTSDQASNWIQTNAPPNSTILIEEWNSILRFNMRPLADNHYKLISFNFYTPDDQTKITNLDKALMQSDYIIVESPKVRNTITKLKNRYKNTALFYANIENGTLGFTKVAEIMSYPRLGPLALADERAEETWYVFDHPTIRIYKKTVLPTPPK